MPVKFNSFETAMGYNAFGGDYWACQTFTPTLSHRITSIKLYLFRSGSASGTLTVSIRATDGAGQPTGPDFCSATYPAASVPTSYTWVEFVMNVPIAVQIGTKYAIVYRDSVNETSINWWGDGAYSPRGSSFDAGTTWTMSGPYTNDFQNWADNYCTVDSASSIEATQASLNGTIYESSNIVERGFDYGTSPGTYTGAVTETGSFGDGAFSLPLTGLTPSTCYYIRAKIRHSTLGWFYSVEISFQTGHDNQLIVFENNGAAITAYQQINGNDWWCQSFTPAVGHILKSVTLQLYRSGSSGVFTVSIRATSGGVPTGGDLCSGSIAVSLIPVTLTQVEIGLGAGCVVQPGTMYAIVCRSQSLVYWGGGMNNYGGGNRCTSMDGGSSWSSQAFDMNFQESGDYSVETKPVSNLGTFRATGNGYSAAGGASFEEFGFEWGTSPGSYPNSVTQVGTFEGIFSLELTGLSHSTPYYYRAKAYYSAYGWVYGAQVTFTTPPPTPVVQTNVPSDVGTTNVVAEAEITSTGGDATCDLRGFVYGFTSHSDPGNVAAGSSGYDEFTTESGAFGTGVFSKLIEGLAPSKFYYVRAWAHNSYGYDYGIEILVVTNENVNVLFPSGDQTKGIRFDSSPGGGYPNPGGGTVDHYLLVRSPDASFTDGGRWGYISGEIVYEYNYYNDNFYTDLYNLTNPTRRDAGVVKIKWKARAGKTYYPYGKMKRELLTHGTQYTGSEVSLGTLGWHCELFYTNPYTGAPWMPAEVDDLAAGISLGQGGGFGIPYADCLWIFVLWANAEVRTDSAIALAEDQVRLRGYVVEDEAEECQVYFEYGPDDSYGNTTAPETKVKSDSFQADVTLAAPVHFRAVIETACGETFYGSERIWRGSGASGRSVADKLIGERAI